MFIYQRDNIICNKMGNTQKIQHETITHPKLGEVVPKERHGKQYIVYSLVLRG